MSGTRSLPIADAPMLGAGARRARLLRAGLTGALAVLVGVAVMLAPRAASTGAAAASPAGRSTEIVFDVSGSVGDSSYAIAGRALERLSHGRTPVGLVLFSDSAEEALPPGSPPSELRPFARIFTPLRRPTLGGSISRHPPVAADPWYPSFSGGTRISGGLAAAAAALGRDHAHGRILLISDLGDAPDDRGKLRKELVSLAQAGVELRVLALPNALSGDRRWFEKLEGRRSLLASLPAQPAPPTRKAGGSHVPMSLAIVAVLLALALAANELVVRSLRWREAR